MAVPGGRRLAAGRGAASLGGCACWNRGGGRAGGRAGRAGAGRRALVQGGYGSPGQGAWLERRLAHQGDGRTAAQASQEAAHGWWEGCLLHWAGLPEQEGEGGEVGVGITQEGCCHRLPGRLTRTAGQGQGPAGPARLEVKLQGQAAKPSVAGVAAEEFLADVGEFM